MTCYLALFKNSRIYPNKNLGMTGKTQQENSLSINELKTKMTALTYLHHMGSSLHDVKDHFPQHARWIEENMDRPFREVMDELREQLKEATQNRH